MVDVVCDSEALASFIRTHYADVLKKFDVTPTTEPGTPQIMCIQINHGPQGLTAPIGCFAHYLSNIFVSAEIVTIAQHRPKVLSNISSTSLHVFNRLSVDNNRDVVRELNNRLIEGICDPSSEAADAIFRDYIRRLRRANLYTIGDVIRPNPLDPGTSRSVTKHFVNYLIHRKIGCVVSSPVIPNYNYPSTPRYCQAWYWVPEAALKDSLPPRVLVSGKDKLVGAGKMGLGPKHDKLVCVGALPKKANKIPKKTKTLGNHGELIPF